MKIIAVFIFSLFIIGCSDQDHAQRSALKAGYKILYSFDMEKTIVEDSSGNVLLLRHDIIKEPGNIKEIIILKKFSCPEIASKKEW